MNKNFKTNGFTFIEILIALSIFGITVSGAISLSSFILQSAQNEAAKAERNIENIEMIKLLTQPIYFGALSGFEQNSQLKICMTIDDVSCTSSEEYPLTAFDLATNLELSMISSTEASSVKNKIYFKVHCANDAVLCDKADYYTVIVRTYLDYHGYLFSSIEKKGVVVPEFNNVVTYVPDATLAAGRPINIILILDNSNSMAYAKDQIKAALDDLISKISTMDATLMISPLGEYAGSTGEVYTLDSDGNKLPMPPWPYPGDFVYYSKQEFKAYYPYVYKGEDPSNFIGISYTRIFPFLTTDSTEIRNNKLLSARNLIDSFYSMPTWYGTGYDTPLCTLLRLFETPGTNPPIKIDPLTPTVFFIITNENDESGTGFNQYSGCYKSHIQQWKTNPDSYAHFGKQQVYHIDVTFNATIDGAPTNYNWPYLNIPRPYNNSLLEGSDCLNLAKQIPTDDFENALVSSVNNISVKYVKGAGYTINKCQIYHNYHLFLSTTTESPEVCSGIENGTTSLQVPDSYIPGTCVPVLQTGSASGGNTEIQYMIPSTSNIVDILYQSMSTRADLKNIFYVPIIHPDNVTCTITSGAQVGTRYMDLAQKPGMNSAVTPVCASDYSTKLNEFSQWTATLGANDIQLSSTVAANLNGVEIVRAGTSIPLVEKVDYSLSGTVLVFRTGLLQPNDIIKVYLK